MQTKNKKKWLNRCLLMLALATFCESLAAAEPRELPRCDKNIKVIHAESAPLQIEHPRTGRVDLEFTIDELGYVSDPIVVQSTEPRITKEALKSVVLWRFAPPSSKCRHRSSVTYEIRDAEDK